MTSLTASRPQIFGSNTVLTIILAGLAGAAIDAVYFSTFALLQGHSPVRVLQSIAGFWFGQRSLDLGAISAITGALTHTGLATIMAAGFVLLARRLEPLHKSLIAAGVVYGLFLYFVMYYVVMPLRWPSVYPRWQGWHSVYDVGVHLVIGLTFAFIFHARSVREGDFDPLEFD